MVSAHTIVCVYVLCTHYVCVPRPSADSAVCVQARNRRCSKINLCICTSVYKFNIDELLLKLLAKRGSLTYFMYLPVQASRGVRDAAVCARAVHTEQNTTRMYWKELSTALCVCSLLCVYTLGWVKCREQKTPYLATRHYTFKCIFTDYDYN